VLSTAKVHRSIFMSTGYKVNFKNTYKNDKFHSKAHAHERCHFLYEFLQNGFASQLLQVATKLVGFHVSNHNMLCTECFHTFYHTKLHANFCDSCCMNYFTFYMQQDLPIDYLMCSTINLVLSRIPFYITSSNC
jgi:hypothetical protein